MYARSAVLALLILLGLPAVASAANGVVIEDQGTGADGWPRLAAYYQPYTFGGPEPAWRVCAPTCGTVVATGNSFTPGPTEPGTTFEASTTFGGVTTTARSGPWRGRIGNVAAPTLVGEPRIGRHVDPRPGAWSGGWGDETSLVGVRACPSAAGVDCVSVSSAGIQPGGGPALIGPAYAGWYVGAYDVRIGARTAFPAIALFFPFGTVSGHRAPGPGETVAVGPLVGPVPAARPGVPPSVSGTLAVGRKVTPRAGTWPDAPADGRISSALRVCPTRQDTAKCVLLNDLLPAGTISAARTPGVELAAANAPVALDAQYLGWYVGAVDRYSRADVGEFPDLDRRPETVPAPGPIVTLGPLSATPVRLGFTPRASIVRRIAGTPRTLRLATVRCAERCVARVTLRGGGKTIVRRVVADGGSTAVRVRHASLRRARSVRVTVRFDDHPAVVRRTVRVG